MAARAFQPQQRYPWDEAYVNAVLETNDDRLRERIREAEAVLASRMVALADGQNNSAELVALERALATLDILKQERLKSC